MDIVVVTLKEANFDEALRQAWSNSNIIKNVNFTNYLETSGSFVYRFEVSLKDIPDPVVDTVSKNV